VTDDEREEFEERAAILEFEAGMCRAWAERIALKMVLDRRARPDLETSKLHEVSRSG